VARQVIWGIVAGIGCLLAILISCFVLVPQLLYPALTAADLRDVAGVANRIQLQQAQDQLQNNVRSALLQVTGGLVVVLGGLATWRQVHVNREGQITERLTRAVDQIGSDNVDVRIGGIYALERIGQNSVSDRYTVQFILGAFVRNHAPWHVGTPDGPEHPTATLDQRPSLRVVAPDIQTAVAVLARRQRARDVLPPNPFGGRLFLSRVDLRGLEIYRGRLVNTHLQYANLARSQLQGTQLDRSILLSADLRECQLEGVSFVDADLSHAHLSGANLRGADLRRATLHGTDLRDADLTDAVLQEAQADTTTLWPSGFDAERLRQAGVRLAAT
jgi:hypothetical protein